MRLIQINDIKFECIKPKVYHLIPTIMWIVRPDLKAFVGGFYKWLLVFWEHDLTNQCSGREYTPRQIAKRIKKTGETVILDKQSRR